MGFAESAQQLGAKAKSFLDAVIVQTQEAFTGSRVSPDPDADDLAEPHNKFTDAELGQPASDDRFVYNPQKFAERIAVGGRVKNKLSTSKCVRIEYRVWLKYVLIAILVLFGAFFTPQLLPRWLGFEWASPSDLCQNRDEKLLNLKSQIENMTRLPELRRDLKKQQFDAQCMDTAGDNFYKRPARFEWDDECTSDLISESLESESCVGPFSRNVCDGASGFRKFLGGLAGTCKSITIPKKCVKTFDQDRAQALLDLEREQNALALDDAVTESQPIIQTANDRATQLINRLLLQVDIASDIYIAYSIIALIIGMPLIIYKREKGSRIMGATFGMRKLTFIIVVVIFLSVYDSLLLILRETDFTRLFRNFRNDPCYVDADFSRQRVNLIVSACNNVTQLAANSSATLGNMDNTFFTARRFGLCKDASRPQARHPRLDDMDRLRTQYRDGNLQFSGICNATKLDAATSSPPDDPEFSKFKALLGSGVLAQLFLKFIFTSWVVHLVAYFEPMVVHNGKVEIWDASTGAKGQADDEMPLTETEQRSAMWFARDKHLLPLIVLSVLMALEVFLIIYSIVVTNTGRRDLLDGSEPPELPTSGFACPFPV